MARSSRRSRLGCSRTLIIAILPLLIYIFQLLGKASTTSSPGSPGAPRSPGGR